MALDLAFVLAKFLVIMYVPIQCLAFFHWDIGVHFRLHNRMS